MTAKILANQQRIERVWRKMEDDPAVRKARTSLKRDGFVLCGIPFRKDRSITLTGYLAAIPLFPPRYSRTKILGLLKLKKHLPLARLLKKLVEQIDDPFTEIIISTDTDMSPEPERLRRRLADTADFLGEILRWDLSIRLRNPRNIIISALRDAICTRAKRPHDRELATLIDAAFRAAGKVGNYLQPATLDRISKLEKEGRVKAALRLRKCSGRRYRIFV